MDADNIAARDVNEIFDSDAFRRTGAVLWPDLWGHSCQTVDHLKETSPGYTAYDNHVLFKAHFGGLQFQPNERVYAQEAEAGQMAWDLRRHAGMLDVARKWIEDEFLDSIVNGDKDMFRLVPLILGEPFHYVPDIPGYVLYIVLKWQVWAS